MDNVFFDNPPVLQGSETTQLQQLYGYLFTVSNKLNEALMAITVEETQAAEAPAGAVTAEEQERQQEYQTLKSMIVKTAQIVRTEMDELSTTLRAETQAVSDELGTLEENLELTIQATAQGVLQQFEQSETIQDTRTNTFYRQRTSQYIFTGELDQVTHEVGIAIGEGVTAYDQDDNPYLNQDAKVATFTRNKLAFWSGSVQLAYFSSGKFYITNGEITNTLQIGNFTWKAMTGGSMALLGPSMATP